MEEKRPCFTLHKSFYEGARPSFLPEGNLALNKGEIFFFSKVSDFLFKKHDRLREKNDRVEKCELVPEQK